MRLLLATRNIHKAREIREILKAPGLTIVTPSDIPLPLPDVVEDGRTFEENAVKKAMMLALAGRLWTLADDSGLEVEALGGEPGVFSARYSGEHGQDEANNALLLQKLGSCTDRRARFRCVLALASPHGRCQIVEGVCVGSIAPAPRGSNGFGYDPLFIPEGHDRTFAEMSTEEKNALSHRFRALQAAREKWGSLFEAADPHDWPSTR